MRARRRLRRQSARSALLSTLVSSGLALTTVLAVAAPLVHAHLDAASSGTIGLCGEHTQTGAGVPDTGPCPICLAAGHGAAALARELAQLLLPVPPARPVAACAATLCAAPDRCPGAPRAPPQLV